MKKFALACLALTLLSADCEACGRHRLFRRHCNATVGHAAPYYPSPQCVGACPTPQSAAVPVVVPTKQIPGVPPAPPNVPTVPVAPPANAVPPPAPISHYSLPTQEMRDSISIRRFP